MPLFLCFFVIIAFYYCLQYHYLRDLEVEELYAAFNIYTAGTDALLRSDDPEKIVSALVYTYGYYPAGSKFIRLPSPIATVLEQGREMSILVLLLHLEKITNAGFGYDLDLWVNEFGNEQTQYSYKSFKDYRKSSNLPVLLHSLLVQPVSPDLKSPDSDTDSGEKHDAKAPHPRMVSLASRANSR